MGAPILNLQTSNAAHYHEQAPSVTPKGTNHAALKNDFIGVVSKTSLSNNGYLRM